MKDEFNPDWPKTFTETTHLLEDERQEIKNMPESEGFGDAFGRGARYGLTFALYLIGRLEKNIGGESKKP